VRKVGDRLENGVSREAYDDDEMKYGKCRVMEIGDGVNRSKAGRITFKQMYR
jgi:hypothetical protein